MHGGTFLQARRFFLGILATALEASCALAGGPKFVAGTAYFNAAVVGQPVHWSAGAVNYSVDEGPLNGQISNQDATAMVDAAAAIWSAVPTAGITLTDSGSLNEDVNGVSVIAGNHVFAAPSDVSQQPRAIHSPSFTMPTVL